MTGRAKWDAWQSISQKISDRPQAEARYLSIARDLGWTEDAVPAATQNQEQTSEEDIWDESPSSGGGDSGGLGISVSRMASDEQPVNENSLHDLAINNDTGKIAALLDSRRIDLDTRDEYVSA